MKTALTISIEKELLRQSRAVAFSKRRTLSAQIEQWIEDALLLEPAPAAAKPAKKGK